MNEGGCPALPLLGGWGLLAASGLIAGGWLVAALRRRNWMRLPPVPWGSELALAALFGIMAGGGLASWCLGALGIDHDDFETNPLPFVLADCIVKAGIVALVWLRLTTARGRPPAVLLGLRPVSGRRLASAFALGYAGLWAPVLLARFAVVNMAALLGIEPNEQPLIHALRQPLPEWQTNTVAVTVLVIAPFIEEFFFRGILYRALRNVAHRPWLPLLGSSGVFAAMHFHPFTFLPLVVLGVVLAVAYEEAGSLWAPVLVHAAFNASQLCLLMQSMAE